MRLQPTERFAKEYARLPQQLQQRVDRALGLLLENPRHPSLQAKKMKGYENRWEARVTLNYRLIFSIESDAYVLLRIGTHDLLTTGSGGIAQGGKNNPARGLSACRAGSK